VINGVTWSKIPSPPGLESASSFSVSVDSGGAIFSAFSVFNGFTYVGRGVYVTLDTGATWTYAGLDSVSILSLLSYGTTTYACTFDHGLYAFERGVSTGVDNPPVVPARMELEQNYPNPFNPTTMIRFTIPERALVKLYVYNVLGQEVASLINEERAPGAYEVRFDARGLSSGAYFYLLRAGSYVQLKKLLILR
jgi:Secretion system C-terminal sorting domain